MNNKYNLDTNQQEMRFKNAFDTSPIGMALVSTDGKWLEVNESLTKIIGYTKEELMTKTFQDITHKEDLDKDLEQVNKMLSGEINTYQMEKRYYHKDGHIVWILLSVSMVKDSQNKPLYFVSQIQDITFMKTKEKELLEKNEELKKVNEAITGREIKMIELKKEVNNLLQAQGKEPKYIV